MSNNNRIIHYRNSNRCYCLFYFILYTSHLLIIILTCCTIPPIHNNVLLVLAGITSRPVNNNNNKWFVTTNTHRIGWITTTLRGGSSNTANDNDDDNNNNNQQFNNGTTSLMVDNSLSSSEYDHHHQHDYDDSVTRGIHYDVNNNNETISSTTASDINNNNNVTILPYWKVSLPEKLQKRNPKTLKKIRIGTVDIYLLGTAHVSNDSSADVKLLLQTIQPDCIFVELCDARIQLMTTTSQEEETLLEKEIQVIENNNNKHKKKSNNRTSFMDRVKYTQQVQGGSKLQALSTVLLTSVQEDYAKELNVELGGEFRCAHEYWKNVNSNQYTNNCHLILGDRPLYITLIRAWESLTIWSKIKVIIGLVWSSLRKPNKDEIEKWLNSILQDENNDILTKSFEELRKHFPTLYTTIITERDVWLAAKLIQTCNIVQPYTQIVAIVGAGHVPGICHWLLTNNNSTTTTPNNNTRNPEDILKELVTTKRWSNDVNALAAIESWVHDVTELQR